MWRAKIVLVAPRQTARKLRSCIKYFLPMYFAVLVDIWYVIIAKVTSERVTVSSTRINWLWYCRIIVSRPINCLRCDGNAKRSNVRGRETGLGAISVFFFSDTQESLTARLEFIRCIRYNFSRRQCDDFFQRFAINVVLSSHDRLLLAHGVHV